MEKVPESAPLISQRLVNFLPPCYSQFTPYNFFSLPFAPVLFPFKLSKSPQNPESQETNPLPSPNPCSVFCSQPLLLFFCSQNPLTQLYVYLPN